MEHVVLRAHTHGLVHDTRKINLQRSDVWSHLARADPTESAGRAVLMYAVFAYIPHGARTKSLWKGLCIYATAAGSSDSVGVGVRLAEGRRTVKGTRPLGTRALVVLGLSTW